MALMKPASLRLKSGRNHNLKSTLIDFALSSLGSSYTAFQLRVHPVPSTFRIRPVAITELTAAHVGSHASEGSQGLQDVLYSQNFSLVPFEICFS